VRVRGPSEQLTALRGVLASLHLPKGLERSLTAQLDEARRAIAAHRPGRACRASRDFARKVRAQTGRKLSPSDADRLLRATRRIQNVLGCAAGIAAR
jgi:hypothetical protein